MRCWLTSARCRTPRAMAEHERAVRLLVPADSPCRRQCTLDDDDLCIGCGRMLHEITGWRELDEAGRARVRAAAAVRLARYRQRWAASPRPD
jgi:uncharacterized protein